MKLITIALTSALIAATQAATNFKNICSTANNQMSSLSQYISQVKAIADRNGHRAVSNKCIEAAGHLNAAQSSWNAISNNYRNSPWEARSCSNAKRCQTRLSLCGSAIDWIRARPEVNRTPAYRLPLWSCSGGHRSCQATCGQVWTWPSPPGYQPRPSGYRRARRDESKALCPAKETACPIAAGAPGTECVDTDVEITSCGGCVTINEGENCLAIAGADEVGCDAGVCRVFSVLPGFEINLLSNRPIAK